MHQASLSRKLSSAGHVQPQPPSRQIRPNPPAGALDIAALMPLCRTDQLTVPESVARVVEYLHDLADDAGVMI